MWGGGNVDPRDGPSGAQVAAASAREAVDHLEEVLRHRMSRLARRWEAGLDEEFAPAPQAWRHSAEETHRPYYLPRPVHERKVLRHKAFELELSTAGEAIEDMELMGYPFQLFRDLESGQDSLVYRDGPAGYRLTQVEPEIGRSWRSRAASPDCHSCSTPTRSPSAGGCCIDAMTGTMG